jgi:hypothetical protein
MNKIEHHGRVTSSSYMRGRPGEYARIDVFSEGCYVEIRFGDEVADFRQSHIADLISMLIEAMSRLPEDEEDTVHVVADEIADGAAKGGARG